MKSYINNKYPSVEDLRKRAKQKIPKFAFEYLDGGCNDDVNIKKNTTRIRDVELKPKYLVLLFSYSTKLSIIFMLYNYTINI